MTVTETRRRDPVSTRASILEGAERLFVEKGFAATSMSDIALAAGVTKSLIHHHFGSKQELWKEIKRTRLAEWVEAQNDIVSSKDASGDLVLKRAIQSYFTFLRENPDVVRLISWMTLEDPSFSELVHPELLDRGVERLRQDQKAGTLRSDVDAKHILSMFVSLSVHWFMGRNTLGSKRLLGDADPDYDADSAYLEDMTTVFLDGLRPRGG